MPAEKPTKLTWSRKNTIAAVTAGVVLVGGIGTAVALQRDDPAPAVVASTTPSATPTPKPTPRPSTPAPTKPKPKPYDPLTGGKPSDHEVLAVKIENISAARPQSGVGDADIVFVEEVEGSLTRLIAVYHTDFPKRVGPVRSARNTDVELLPMFGRPGLVYSGANRRVQRNIERSPIQALPRSTRDPSRVIPHNIFVDLNQVARSEKVAEADSIGWTFAANDARWGRAAKDGEAAGRVGGDRMSFDYGNGRYTVRWNGQTYAGGARTDNVIVMGVKTRPDGNADVNGARSVKSATVGRGAVTIYRDGRKLTGTWKRAGDDNPMHLLDSQGKPLPLKPGKTWVLLSG